MLLAGCHQPKNTRSGISHFQIRRQKKAFAESFPALHPFIVSFHFGNK
jgi:hypothetical protein